MISGRSRVAGRLVAGCLLGAVAITACTSSGRTDAEPPGASPASPKPSASGSRGGVPTSPSRSAPPASPSSPAEPAGDDPVVVAAGDIACGPEHAAYRGGSGTDLECRQKATFDRVEEIDPDAVLALGDLQYEVGGLASFRAAYDKTWGRVKDITYPAPGNHEYGTGVAPGYYDYFGKRAGERGKGYYSADIGSWHLVALNSNCHVVGGCDRGSPQERWLRQDLARNRSRCTVAIWHHPRWSSGVHGDSEKVDGLWRTLVAGSADLLLTGHDHDYERFAPIDADGRVDQAAGVREFVVGTGGRSLYFFGLPRPGSQVRASTAFGVLEMTLQDDGYSWRFVPADGNDFEDEGAGRCH